jgi:hypothetical protein
VPARCRAVVLLADLGSPNVAAFTAELRGVPVVVVNQLARSDPAVGQEAARVLAAAGVEEESIREVLNGIRR